MSDDTTLSEIVTEEVTDQLDASDLLGDGSIEDQLDAGDIGAAVGRQFGAQLGRELGEAIGGNVHEALASGLEEDADRESVVEETKTGVGNAVREVFSGLESREALVSLLEGIGGEGGVGEQVSSAIPEVSDSEEGEESEGEGEGEGEDGDGDESGLKETVEDATPDVLESEDEGEGEAAEGEDEAETDAEEPDGEEDLDEDAETAEEGGEEPAGDGEDAESDSDSESEDEDQDQDQDQSEDGLEAEDLEGIRRDTLEDLLEVMSYQDLQSVAKDVGVKANLSREEMTDEIIDTVAATEAE